MNSQYMIKSIYRPQRKAQDVLTFPKIHHSPVESNMQIRGIGKKYNRHNIFKQDDEKDKLEEDKRARLRFKEDQRSRDCQQLQEKIADMLRKHGDEMREIDERSSKIQEQISKAKKNQYDIKLQFWEIKNQVLELANIYGQEEQQYRALIQAIDYEERQEEAQNQMQGEGNVDGEVDMNGEVDMQEEQYMHEEEYMDEDGREIEGMKPDKQNPENSEQPDQSMESSGQVFQDDKVFEATYR